MTTCRDLSPLLADRAAGDLTAAGAARLEEHLAGCPACRAEAAADEAVLSLARLPPPSDRERSVLAGLADSLRLARAAAARRRGWAGRAAAGLAVAAAAAAFLMAPAFTRRAPLLTPEEAAAARAAPAVAGGRPADHWAAPDPDELWEAAGALLADEVPAPAERAVSSDPTRLAAVSAADAWFDTDTDTDTARE